MADRVTSRVCAAALALSVGWAAVATAQVAGRAETAMFETAQGSGLAADHQAHLDAYPQGAFADAARQELQWGTGAQLDAMTFTTSLDSGPDGVAGRSIADLLTGTPVFPPIKGPPDELWKGQPCTACHQWTAAALCDQGATYSRPALAVRIAKPHPLGIPFKKALRAHAEGGCRLE